MAFPFNITFSNSDYLLITQLEEPLHNLGFSFKLKDNSIEINGIPPECTKENLEAIFEEILEQEKNDDKLKSNYYVGIVINIVYLILIIPGIIMMEDGQFCKYYSIIIFITYIFSYKIINAKIK